MLFFCVSPQGVKFPFDRVLFCNIGDCHAMGQRPLTFVRQLLAACLDPTTLHAGAYPSDVIERSNTILDSCKGNSLGKARRLIPIIREVAHILWLRQDGAVFLCFSSMSCSSRTWQHKIDVNHHNNVMYCELVIHMYMYMYTHWYMCINYCTNACSSSNMLTCIQPPTSGAYSDSRGIPVIRKHIAEFISKRDEMPCAVDSVYLSNGASDGIKRMLYLCLSKNQALRTGVMIPIPQYPLYTASIAEMNAFPVSTLLDHRLRGFIQGLLICLRGWGP